MEDEQTGAYELAYNEAVRALAQQQSRLDDFRARAGIVLSAAAIATSILGGQALDQGSPSLWAWIALGAFIGVSGLALLLLSPRTWTFTAVPRRIIGTYVEAETPLALPMIHRDLALHMEDSYVKNEVGLDRMIMFFRVALALLALEVVSWTIEIAMRG